ncbi:P-loop containing nucleoside triphosphate hydrolase protein [Sistotremastrum suecicum HHB10207 ss-3]|uniref:p-loop containing nucleoside triphosphate hydrolase protein n=1 Tax=Sistotremastrum suecicum HHB10207 ss-3 TaxID=1314776 RepID=A0A165XN49_9AGAM|nr:P-loop containing nucleoside triphosphate hydrolase protein [Sistotremastrum suecicum HHB10207 ss-3]
MSRKQKSIRPIPTVSKLKKDPGVPKLPNLKQKVVLKQAIHNHNKERRQGARSGDVQMAVEPTLASLAMEAAEADAQESLVPSDPGSSTEVANHARRQYIRTLHKVIEQSDVIVLVLDARDPEGCRSRLVEEEVRRREGEGKKLVFVLNKIDLVPKENAEAWLRYLRHTAPTVAFRSSTQEQRTNLTSKTSPRLLNLLKSYKTPSGSITVGVVGYPNVGKSSLINSLKRAKVCAVAAEPGWTKEMQTIQVERGLKILDSPGVVFDDPSAESQNLLLRNVLKVDSILDPIAVVASIYERTTGEVLAKIYGLPPPAPDSPSNALKFLTQLALTSGRLLKAGIPDLEAAARVVIGDWNAHKIPFHSEVPKVHTSSIPSQNPGEEDVGDAKIIAGGLGDRFELEGLWDPEVPVADDEPERMDEDGNMMESDDLRHLVPRKRERSPTPAEDPLPFADADMSIISTTKPPRPEAPPSKRRKSEPTGPDVYETSFMANSNPMSRKAQRKDMRKNRKAVSRKVRNDMEVEMEPEVGGGSPNHSFTFRASLGGIVSVEEDEEL